MNKCVHTQPLSFTLCPFPAHTFCSVFQSLHILILSLLIPGQHSLFIAPFLFYNDPCITLRVHLCQASDLLSLMQQLLCPQTDLAPPHQNSSFDYSTFCYGSWGKSKEKPWDRSWDAKRTGITRQINTWKVPPTEIHQHSNQTESLHDRAGYCSGFRGEKDKIQTVKLIGNIEQFTPKYD